MTREPKAEFVNVGATRKFVEKGKWLAAGWNTWGDLNSRLSLFNLCQIM